MSQDELIDAAFLPALLNGTEDWIWSVESDTFGLLSYNAPLREHFSARFGIALRHGLRPCDLLPPGHAGLWEDFYRRALRDGPFSIEYATHGDREKVLLISVHPLLRDGHAFALAVFGRDISAFKRAESAAQEQLRCERLIANISATLIASSAEGLPSAIHRCLEELVEVLGVDGATLWETLDDNVARRSHVHARPGFPDAEHAELRANALPWHAGQIVGGKTVVLRRIPDDLPEEAVEDREYCASRRLKSSIAVPLRVGRALLGAMVFQFVSRHCDWQPEIIARLQLMGEVFANALLRKRQEDSLRVSEHRFATVFRNAPSGIVITHGIDGPLVAVNDQFCTLFGYARDELLGRTSIELGLWGNLTHRDELFRKIQQTGRIEQCEVRFCQKSGNVRHGLFSAEVIELTGSPQVLGTLVDVTDRKRAEEERLELERRLLHAQKLESLGILAGGIAHDFNNVLDFILGNANLAISRLPANSALREKIGDMIRAAERGAELTRQMLDYSGKHRSKVRSVDVSQAVAEVESMISAFASRSAVIKYALASNLPPILADPTQIQQVIVNLAINAAEAVGENGEIGISTDLLLLDAEETSGGEASERLPQGRYVRLDVADTGCGMDASTRARIFDPFYTTKATGRGLGLAVVQGIVRSHGGAIRVRSRPGEGACFTVLLPVSGRIDQAETGRSHPATARHSRGASRAVLVVDDEPMARRIRRLELEAEGFSVLTAAGGAEAVQLFRERQTGIACILLDVSMPHVNGYDVFREVRDLRGDVPVIFCTGYSATDVAVRLANETDVHILPKPIDRAAMFELVGRFAGPDIQRDSTR